MSIKTFGYVRVSSKEQNVDRQVEAIEEYCKENNIFLEERDIFIDKSSGKNFDRDGYRALKRCLRQGDTLIIKELDRLARNMRQIKEEWQDLVRNGINIIVIDTPIINTVNKTDIEKALISNITFELLTYISEKERRKIKQRQAEGIAIAKAKGKHLGRPRAKYPDNWKEIYTRWQKGEIKAVEAMDLLELKKSTFYKLVKKYKEINI